MGAKAHPRLLRSICGGALGAALAMTPAAGNPAGAAQSQDIAGPAPALAEPLTSPPATFPAADDTPVRGPAQEDGRNGDRGSGSRSTSGSRLRCPASGVARHSGFGFGNRFWAHGGRCPGTAELDAKPGERRGRHFAGPHRDRSAGAGRNRDRRRPGGGARPPAHAPVSASYGIPGGWLAGHHTGVDFAMPVGTPVRSVGAGVVVHSGWQGSYGNTVKIQLADGCYALYAHLARIDLEQGARVRTHTPVGLSGNTGRSTGPHLHFEIRSTPEYGSDVDPLDYLRNHGAPLP